MEIPEWVWQWIHDYLEKRSGEHFYEIPATGEGYIAAYFLAHCDLTEHGISIHGCWLTESGEEALKFLKENGVDWDETTQEWG